MTETIVKMKSSNNQAALELENCKTAAVHSHDFEMGGRK